MITAEQLEKFYDDDDAQEIARYTASNMNMLLGRVITIEQFIAMHKPEEVESED